jgi:hypothetical protein
MNGAGGMKELELFKTEVNLVQYAAGWGFTEFDRNKSSKACVVLRHRDNDGKIGVSRGHDGHWIYYDFRCGKGGSVIDFVMRQMGISLGKTRKELRKALCANTHSLSPTAPSSDPRPAAKDRRRAALEYANANSIVNRHPYLASRGIGLEIITTKRFSLVVMVDPRNNACFPYFDFEGIAGLERRNHNFNGYTEGGSKGLWRSNLMAGDTRAVIFESPIDALSYAMLHSDPDDRTRYFATGGQISRKQWELLDGLVERSLPQKTSIVLSFDNDPGGRSYVRLFLGRYPHVKFELDMPLDEGQDWNDVLKKIFVKSKCFKAKIRISCPVTKLVSCPFRVTG